MNRECISSVKNIDEKSIETAFKSEEKYNLSNIFDANTFCKLGHLHLILEEYEKGN